MQLIGDKPTEEMLRYATDDIEVTGAVDDLTPYLDEAAVVVAPMRLGGGVRLKVLEALSAGKAVVTSSIGVQGISVKHGEHFMLANTDREFSDTISQLLADPHWRGSLGTQARKWAVANLRSEKSADAFEELYEKLLKTRDGSPGTGPT